jgi:WD40 repeat protein/predicted Ser/Thr protein kinase
MNPEPEDLATEAETLGGFGPDVLHRACEFAREQVAAADVPDLTGETIGRYRVVRPLGAGGFGAVYEAEQLRPVRRRVAIKLAGAGSMNASAAQRLMDEQQTLAAIQDPSIVALLDTGTIPPEVVGGAERPYFVMQLVEGLPITRFADERGLGLRERLELLAEAARGVAAAHRHGVIHRDLKPAHMLVEETGQVRLIDFGVARAEHPDRMSQTLTGQLIGTPRYMSPEQRAGRVGEIDTRSDVYALGMVLAELVVGERITDLDPVTVSRTPTSELLGDTRHAWRRRCRRDVDWIVAKALADRPEDRYGSVEELRADLRRACVGESVLARPRSVWLPLLSFGRRRPAAAATIIVLLLVMPVGSAVVARLAIRNADLARDASREAESAKSEARAARLAGAQAALGAGAIKTAQLQLDLIPAELHDWAYLHLSRSAMPQGRELLGVEMRPGRASGMFQALALSPEEHGLFVGDAAGDLWVMAPGDGSVSARGRVADQVFCAAYAPDRDGLLAIGCANRTVAVYGEGALDRPLATIAVPGPPITLAFDASGRTLAAGMVETNQIAIISMSDFRVEAILPSGSVGCHAAAFMPGADLLFLGTPDGFVESWDVPRKLRRARVLADGSRIQHIEFSADGSRLAATGLSGRLALFQVSAEGELVQIGQAQQPMGITACAFTSAGDELYTGGADGAVRRWGLPELLPDGVWFQHDSEIYGLAISDQTGEIYSCSIGGTVLALDPAEQPPATERRVILDADTLWDAGVRYALVKTGLGMRVIDAVSGDSWGLSHPRMEQLGAYYISPDGEAVLFDQMTGDNIIFHPGGEPVRLPADPSRASQTNPMVISPDDRQVLAIVDGMATLLEPPGTLAWVDVATGQRRGRTAATLGSFRIAAAFGLEDGGAFLTGPDGARLVGPDGPIRGLEWPSGGRCFGASAQGPYLIVSSIEPSTVLAYELATGRVHARFALPQDSNARVAITPDGRTIATTRHGGTVDLYEAATGRLLLTLPGSDPPVRLRFDSDGTLRFGSQRGALRLWRAAAEQAADGAEAAGRATDPRPGTSPG